MPDQPFNKNPVQPYNAAIKTAGASSLLDAPPSTVPKVPWYMRITRIILDAMPSSKQPGRW